jgi:hypothetical protein
MTADELAVIFYIVQYDVVVVTGFEIVKYVLNFAFFINQEADAMNAVIGFTHKGFSPQTPNSSATL